MDNYDLIIDILSDEENNRYSTPIITLPVNVVGRLKLSDSSVEVLRGSDSDLESTQDSNSTLDSEPKEALGSFRDLPELSPTPVLKDITNMKNHEYNSTKAEKLNDLGEPSAKEIEENNGIKPDDKEFYCLAGQGYSFTSTKIQRPRKHPVRVVREILHCTGEAASRARGALSRPAPGRCYT